LFIKISTIKSIHIHTPIICAYLHINRWKNGVAGSTKTAFRCLLWSKNWLRKMALLQPSTSAGKKKKNALVYAIP